jgi:hypothetical protein
LKVILISGKAEHGKTSTAYILEDCLKSSGKKVIIANYGDLVKYTCKTFFGWNGVKDEKGREILQRIGTNCMRAKYPTFWADYVYAVLDVFRDDWDYAIIADCRFSNEVEKFKNSRLDTITIRVQRNNFESSLTEEQKKHESETGLDNYKFDYYITAENGIGNLETAVYDFYKKVLSEKD